MRSRAVWFGILLVLWSPPALAGDEARLGVGIKAMAAGKDRPALLLEPRDPVKKLEVALARSDGKKLTLRSGVIKAGQRKELPIDQPPGELGYEAHFKVVWGDGETSDFSITFKLTRVGELKLSIGPEDVDLDGRRLQCRTTNPAASAELTIYGEAEQVLAVVQETYEAAVPGTNLVLAWEPLKAEIVSMQLKVTDVAGFWTGMRITPFSIEIPHDDLVFDSGKSNVRADQEPKLGVTMGFVNEALAKHQTLLELKLFVAGYTDSVGSKGSNVELSQARARSIAAWFRGHGLKIPIYYQGFGEDVLAKPTPDETEEPANRRAVYILASQQPPVSKTIPRRSWHKL
jgi:outer membrane protein OmpA-like peptidoglycan-associated protein